jgi:hypothetical protein
VGLFASTSDNRLYPNPEAPALVPEAMQLFEFLGRMLGKVCICHVLRHPPVTGLLQAGRQLRAAGCNEMLCCLPLGGLSSQRLR